MDTVEVKTVELIGAALDWAVGYSVRSAHIGVGAWSGSREAWLSDWSVQACYSPSTDWSDIGMLIDKYVTAMVSPRDGYWWSHARGANGERLGEGDTVNIAVCRAIISAELGDTISIPSELMQ